MKQMTFAHTEYAGKRKQTRKELLLAPMENCPPCRLKFDSGWIAGFSLSRCAGGVQQAAPHRCLPEMYSRPIIIGNN